MPPELFEMLQWFDTFSENEKCVYLGVLVAMILRTMPSELQNFWKTNLDVRLNTAPTSVARH